VRSRLGARLGTGVAAAAVVAAAGLPAAVDASTSPPATAVYIVVLRSAPLATFDGNRAFEPTAPRPGHRFNALRSAVEAYAERLLRGQDRVAAALGDPDVLYSYTTAIDGFAARLTPAQARLAQAQPQVASVHADRVDRVDGGPSPGAALTAGLALEPPPGNAGRGVVIGVIDSGIWPENPSFAAPPLDRAQLRDRYPGFTGRCDDAGDHWSASLCSAKLVAAHAYVEAFGSDDVSAAEYLSPRDGSGHGSHVAATAAGDAGVDVRIDHQDFGRRSGVAPGAALAVYKACWAAPDPSGDGCSNADALAAVDQAVHDGVDVINYAASSPEAALDDPLESAFANAASAGVFVATSAGDRGPRPGTLAHGTPWVTTVAATAKPTFQGGAVLGDGSQIFGSMASDRSVADRRLVYGGDVPAPGATARQARLCEPGSIDASRVHDAVVLCERGVTSRVSKSAAVAQAGAKAMILANTGPGATVADLHAVPTLHVDAGSGAEIRRYVQSAAHPTATLDPDARDAAARTHVAAYSGRGPTVTDGGAAFIPDVAAPGTNVIAAVAPPFNFGRLWDLYSGTSMAVPQIAGLAAALMSKHPDWSPAAVKSALVTTARPLTTGAGPFAAGGGEADPARAADPGVVYDADASDYRNAKTSSIDVNAASISVASLTATTVVPRRVTGVGDAAETYSATISGLPGIAVRVNPPTLQVAPGSTQRFRVTLSARSGARYGDFVTGRLTWTGSLGHVATSPIVVRAEAVAAPADVHGFGSAGDTAMRAQAGVTGTVRTRVVGPTGAIPAPLLLAPGDFDPAAPQSSAATAARTFYVPEGTFAARFATDLVVDGDTDLYVFRDGRPVAQATSKAAGEQLTIRRPPAGLYTVYVNAPSVGPSSAVAARFTGWVLAADEPGVEVGSGIAVNPARARVTGGEPVDFQLRWSGLDASQRWLGAVRYRGSDDVTFVTVN
jgi:hypothetical protein